MPVASPTDFPQIALEDNLMINLSNGVGETLQKMANVECTFEKAFTDKTWTPPEGFSVFLDVESPPSHGQIRFHFSHKALIKLYNNIMNETSVPVESEVLDCLGEFSNVSYGVAKRKLNGDGFSLNMALPHASTSKDIPNVVSTKPKTIIPFNIFEEKCYIEVVILSN